MQFDKQELVEAGKETNAQPTLSTLISKPPAAPSAHLGSSSSSTVFSSAGVNFSATSTTPEGWSIPVTCSNISLKIEKKNNTVRVSRPAKDFPLPVLVIDRCSGRQPPTCSGAWNVFPYFVSNWCWHFIPAAVVRRRSRTDDCGRLGTSIAVSPQEVVCLSLCRDYWQDQALTIWLSTVSVEKTRHGSFHITDLKKKHFKSLLQTGSYYYNLDWNTQFGKQQRGFIHSAFIYTD